MRKHYENRLIQEIFYNLGEYGWGEEFTIDINEYSHEEVAELYELLKNYRKGWIRYERKD